MDLLTDDTLEQSSVVANCTMNRERELLGTNGYDQELRFDPLDFVRRRAAADGSATWLDLCCGSGRALIDAADVAEAEELPIRIIGVDLVDMFRESNSSKLSFVAASLTHWQPTAPVDLITCVHGLHYIGDKLRLISRAAGWLTNQGRFAANLDLQNILLRKGSARRQVAAALRSNGCEYSFRHKLLHRDKRCELSLPFRYLGADDQAGPNYTGQPAVTSHYERVR